MVQLKKQDVDIEQQLSIIQQQLQKQVDLLEKVVEYQKPKYKYNLFTRIKRFFRPRLGVFHHHPPIVLGFPKHYYNSVSMDRNLPVISIVTPSFKQAHFLERTIQSVLNQKYENLDYIVQDGGSHDGTVEILQQYAPSLSHWESRQDKGQSHAINLGFQHASGEIMAYLNSDDILLPGTLHYVADFFARHPEIDVIYGHRIIIDEHDDEVGRWVFPPHDNEILSWADYIPQETLFWRRRIWDAAGGQIDENFQFAMDWDLLLRFRNAGAKFFRVPRFLGAFRVHSEQKSSAQISKTGQKEMAVLRERCHGRKISEQEIRKNIRKYLWTHILYQKLYRLGILSH